jgi:NAD-dependent deacetylase
MFSARPDLTWKYIHQIEAACRGAKPNAGHEVLASLGARTRWLGVLTQNVDGFHRRAGSDPLVEIHGDLRDLHCTACAWTERVVDYATLPPVPRCPQCEAIVRPRVVLFGEMLPTAAVERWTGWQSRGFDLVVSIGTTSAFPYIAEPVVTAARRGVLTVEINPDDTEVSDLVDLRIRAGARDTLVATWAALGSGAPA